MNSSACSAVICQPSGCEQNHDIDTQCGATAPERTIQIQVIVNQTQNSANPTQQLVVGSRPSKYTKFLTGKVPNCVSTVTSINNSSTIQHVYAMFNHIYKFSSKNFKVQQSNFKFRKFKLTLNEKISKIFLSSLQFMKTRKNFKVQSAKCLVVKFRKI